MRAISRARWDSLAAYCRKPLAQVLSEELAWFEVDSEKIIATLILDPDGEFSGIILARDGRERFRWVGGTGFFDSPEAALIALHHKIEELAPNIEELRIQGDESGKPVDFFTPVVPESKLHPNFLRVSAGDEFSAARELISSMMRWHEDVDGNFVEQFQTTGFNARVWELYLFAALTEANLEVTNPKPAPDFLVRGIYGEFALEATTINPSMGGNTQANVPPKPESDEELKSYHRHYLPIKYAGPLTAKLKKEYWKHPSAAGKPLVFAIQDFHHTMSMTYSGSALPAYLYGLTHETQKDEAGHLISTPHKIDEHKWGTKVVPSKFFSQPETENISAVIFNSGGTIAKFNRMGVSAGFGSENVLLVRQGTVWDLDPDASTPAHFVHVVSEGDAETWIEGMDVFHNPNALYPLDPNLLPGAKHHRLREDGQIETASTTAWNPIASSTSVLMFPPQKEAHIAVPDVVD